MKIIREINGKQVEIELTDEEIRLSHDEYERECRKQDIYSQFEGRYEQDFLDTITDEDLDKMCNEVERNIDHADPYFDTYWDCIEPVVDDYLKSRGVVDD